MIMPNFYHLAMHGTQDGIYIDTIKSGTYSHKLLHVLTSVIFVLVSEWRK